MNKPAFGLGENYRTDGKRFRKARSLSYRQLKNYPHTVGCALSASHAKLIWEWVKRHG